MGDDKARTLYFEGAGTPGTGGAVGNCRIRTALTNDAGERYYLELQAARYNKAQIRHIKGAEWVRPGQVVGFVDRCHKITEGPDADDGSRSRHPIERTRHFRWDPEGIRNMVNEELGCSFGAAVVAPALSGYRVFRKSGCSVPGDYNYGDEFEYDRETTEAAQRIYERELARQRDAGERYPCVSAWRDPDDPGILHVRHARKGFESFDADLRGELGRGGADAPFRALQDRPPALEADIARAAEAAEAAKGARGAAAKRRQ